MEPLTWLLVAGALAALPGADLAGDLGQYGGGFLALLLMASFVSWVFVQLVRVANKPLERRVERIERRQKHIGHKVGLPDDELDDEPSQTRGFLTFWRR